MQQWISKSLQSRQGGHWECEHDEPGSVEDMEDMHRK